MEVKLQAKIIKWLKDQGAYVIKNRAAPGIPVGCPDIIALYCDTWLAIECKRSKDAPYQTGQEATLKHLREMNTFVYVAYPENWAIIKEEIATQFF